MRQTLLFLSLLQIAPAGAQVATPPTEEEWHQQMKKGREAVAIKDHETARALFEDVRNAALTRRDDAAGLAAVQMLALLSRAAGDWAKTEDWLSEALDYTGRMKGYESVEAVHVMTEIAGARRARQNFDGAAATLQQALNVALNKGEPQRPLAARVATTLGLVQLERKQNDAARASLELAVLLWNETLRDDPELLPALETLGGLLRDASDYAAAAPFYERSLRIREIAFGPNSPELIGGLDNLSYVYFGLLRFADAEPLYKRLIQIWTDTAGADHPMLALAMDKAAEFYAAQKRFEEADEMAKRAAEIRAKSYVESLRLRARISAHLSPENAIGFSEKALQVIDIAGLPRPEQKVLPAPKSAKSPVPAKAKAAKSKSAVP